MLAPAGMSPTSRCYSPTGLNATGVRVILFTFVRLSKIVLGTGIPERLMHKETLCHAPALRFSTRDLYRGDRQRTTCDPLHL